MEFYHSAMSNMNDQQPTHLYPTLPERLNDLNKTENGHTGNGNGKFGSEEPPHFGSLDAPPVGKKDYKYFWKRVLQDLTNKNLVPVKILFFFKYATLFVLYPFLTLHMDALGLNEWEIGVNQATAPIVAILGPSVAGLIADKIGNFKIVLSAITLANAAIALLLLLVPVARETVKLPSNITFEMNCDPATHHFLLQSIDPYECKLNSSRWSFVPTESIIECGQVCYRSKNETTSDNEVFPKFPLNAISNFSFSVKNQSYIFQTSSKNMTKFECESDGFAERCTLSTSYDTTEAPISEETEATTAIPQSTILQHSTFSFRKLVLDNSTESTSASSALLTIANSAFNVHGPFTFDGVAYQNPTCTQPSERNDEHACETKCFLQLERKLFCDNESVLKVYDVSLTFGIYTLFRLMLGFASATSFIMFEGAVLAILKQYGGDYGLQRVSATFAAIIAAPLSGMLLQTYSFKPVFYLYAALQAFSAFLTLKIDLKFKKPSENVLGHLKEVLSQVEILIFFVAMLCSGTAWGYLETFLFLFLKKLGGSQTLMGLTISVGGLFGLPFLLFSRPIIKRFGHVNVLCLGLLFYGIRYIGYSFIQNPWLCLPFEAMESITSSLAITAAATYAVALSSLQTIASVQGIMGSLYFGIGRGAGSFFGGLCLRTFGHRQTFQIFSICSFIACLLYVLVNILYLRKHSKARSSEPDILNTNGLVISNGSAKLKPVNSKSEQFQMKPTDHDSELGYGKVNPGFDDGDNNTTDHNKFTDIPLDEDNQVNNNRLHK